MNSVVMSSDSSISWKLNCIKSISLCFNCFAFYTFFSKVYPDSSLQLFGASINYYGVFGGVLGVLLELCKSGSAENIQAQKSKGDTNKGIVALSFSFILISVCSTGYNGITYVYSIERNKINEIIKRNEDEVNVLKGELSFLNSHRENILSIIETNKGTIERREKEIEIGTRIDTDGRERKLEPWRVTEYQEDITKATNGNKEQNENLEIKDNEITEVNKKISSLENIKKPEVSYFYESGFPKFPILFFIMFGVFMESIIFIYQRAISFVKAKDNEVDFHDETTSLHHRALMLEKSSLEIEKKRISELTLMLENQVKKMQENNTEKNSLEQLVVLSECKTKSDEKITCDDKSEVSKSLDIGSVEVIDKVNDYNAKTSESKAKKRKKIEITSRGTWSKTKIVKSVLSGELKPTVNNIKKRCGIGQEKAKYILNNMSANGLLIKEGSKFTLANKAYEKEEITTDDANIVKVKFGK